MLMDSLLFIVAGLIVLAAVAGLVFAFREMKNELDNDPRKPRKGSGIERDAPLSSESPLPPTNADLIPMPASGVGFNRYRKIPVVIEAVRVGAENIEELGVLLGTGVDANGCLHVDTIEGPLRVKPGSWLIRGVNGEYYPCQDDIFRKVYEAA